MCWKSRYDQNYTLRKFCDKFDFEPIFISCLESNYLKPEVILKDIDHILEAYAIPRPNDLEEVLKKSYTPFDRERFLPFIIGDINTYRKMQDCMEEAANKYNR